MTDRDYNASLNILRRSGSVRPLDVELRPLPVSVLARWSRESGSPVRKGGVSSLQVDLFQFK
nr:transposase [Sulfuracidifex tepidarius]